jgi:hypothetical protein
MVTPKGVFANFTTSLVISHDGDRIWSVRLLKKNKFRLLMQCFKTRKSLFFNFEHKKQVLSVMVAEDLGMVLSGGLDHKVVLHCLYTGKTIRVLKLGIRTIYCFLRLGNVVAIGGKHTVVFYDLPKQKVMEIPAIKTECIISCMQLGIEKSSKKLQKNKCILLVGGPESTKLKHIILPKSIRKKST